MDTLRERPKAAMTQLANVQRSRSVNVPYTANDIVRVVEREVRDNSAQTESVWSGIPSVRSMIGAPVRAVKWFIAPAPLPPMPGSEPGRI